MKLTTLLPPLRSIRFLHLFLDICLICISLILSLYLRVGLDVGEYVRVFYFYCPIFIAVRLGTFYSFNVYNFIWRYVSARDAFRLGQAVVASSCILLSISFLISDKFGFFPRSVFFIDAILLTFFMMGVRLLRRLIFEAKQASGKESIGRRTLIYGAGYSGKTLSAQLRSSHSGYELIGFLDDDPKKHGLSLDGMRVWGGIENLETLIEELQVKEIFIAGVVEPSALRKIVQRASRYNIRPFVANAFGSERNETQIKQISLGDLLNRSSVSVDLRPVENLVKDKVILVTGAGGSIGSELCRQIVRFEPKRLLLLDHSEYNLFEIDKELRVSTQEFSRIVPILTDLKDTTSLTTVFKTYEPDVVIHAAAYKHVHLVEANPYSAIMNNVQGTKNLLDLCLLYSIKNFVLISTDKAVNPVGVMGATKRVCELLTTLAAIKSGRNYSSVRFGNVLGSSGSLIPTLQEQIRKGGPVTVTHKDMTRFFMLIPEAVSLVLKAATIATPGDINILKMGEPVKILDIAKNLIALSGKTEKDIHIVFTGARPGEKLFEELYIRGDELKTEHPDILTMPNGDSELLPHVSKESALLEEKINEMIHHLIDTDGKSLTILNDLMKSNLLIQADKTLGQN